MLFVNLSEENVKIVCENNKFEIDRINVEKDFAKILINLYKNNKFEKIIAINGPGGFTNIRIGCMLINLLNEINNKKLKIYNISKIRLFEFAYKKGFLPQVAGIFIGQKNNVRKYDLQNNQYEKIAKNNLKINKGFVEKSVNLGEKFDELDVGFENGKIILDYNRKSLKIDLEKDLNIHQKKHLQANYMISANISQI